MSLCNEQTSVTYAYFPKKVPFCGKSDILTQFQVSRHICLFSDFYGLNFSLILWWEDKVPVQDYSELIKGIFKKHFLKKLFSQISFSLCHFVHLSGCLGPWAQMDFKFLIFFISALINHFSSYLAYIMQQDNKQMRNILLLFLLFCFVTKLVRPQLFSCILTMFPLLFFPKNVKNKAVRKQTTITCNQGLPRRKSKLNMITYFCCS